MTIVHHHHYILRLIQQRGNFIQLESDDKMAKHRLSVVEHILCTQT